MDVLTGKEVYYISPEKFEVEVGVMQPFKLDDRNVFVSFTEKRCFVFGDEEIGNGIFFTKEEAQIRLEEAENVESENTDNGKAKD